MARSRKPQPRAGRLHVRARSVIVGDLSDVDVFMLGFSDHIDGRWTMVELVRPIDRFAHVADKYTFGLSYRRERVHDGALRGWSLGDGVLDVDVDARAAKALGFAGFTIEFNAKKFQDRVREGLGREVLRVPRAKRKS